MENFINSISENLILKDGIWFSKDKGIVSYPKDGNDLCFQLEENSFWFHMFIFYNCPRNTLKNTKFYYYSVTPTNYE